MVEDTSKVTIND